MITSLCRAFILYLVVILAVRLMGKRQIGEMQPTELVMTILLSEVAATPMQDPDLPLINSVLSVLLLVCLAIFTSVFSMHSHTFRKVFDGSPAIVVCDGKIDQKKMKKLRLTVQDLLSALRQKDIFELSQVQYAIVETNGSVSVMLKPENSPVTAKMAKVKTKDTGLEHIVICDGKVIPHALEDSGIGMKEINKELKRHGLNVKDVLLLTYSKDGFKSMVRKDNE